MAYRVPNGAPLVGFHFGRGGRCVVCSVSFKSLCKAALSVSDDGKAFARLGFKIATDEPFVTSAKNLPRSSFEKSERLYSERMEVTVFFTQFPLCAGDATGAEQADAAGRIRA